MGVHICIRGHNNYWPWSDLVSLFMRHKGRLSEGGLTSKLRVMELGPGTGNNFPFWESLNVSYFGIEQSPSAVAILVERFPNLRASIRIGDFTRELNQFRDFDVICDRASVTHGSSVEVAATIDACYETLRPGGLYLGVDWFSTNHSDFLLPSVEIDAHTRSELMTGQFVGVGKVHFSSRDHLLDLFSEFDILELSEKISTAHFPDVDTHRFASWNIVARRPR